MRTTLLNPGAWLLAATFVAAVSGMLHGRSARDAMARVTRAATAGPALAVLALAAAGGLGSRIVVGYLSPGAYAEEVLGARAFLSNRDLYRGDDRADLARWLREEPAAVDAWTLPGVSECQASALSRRPQFYTSQAHSPVLLLSSVPVVRAAGGRGLYVAIVVLSFAAIATLWWTLGQAFDVRPRSRESALLAVALAGWQPLLAGIRQGDAVVLAAALVAGSWLAARRSRFVTAGAAAGLAAIVSLPAAGALLALFRWPKALLWGAGSVAAASLAAAVIGGPLLFVDFGNGIVTAARTYAGVMPNYALAGRMAGAGYVTGTLLAGAGVLLAAFAWWRARTIDTAYATFVLLGLLLAPLAWSQHLSLAAVPLAVLLATAARSPRCLDLAVWAALALAVSLPDPAVAIVAYTLGASTWPIVPFALAGLWAWSATLPVPRAGVAHAAVAGRS